MTPLPSLSDQLRDQASTADRVVADAKRLYEGLANDVMIEEHARRAVAEIWTGSIKVTNFVPVLALRSVREQLVAAADPTSGTTTAPRPTV
jgi:hypothetical protein